MDKPDTYTRLTNGLVAWLYFYQYDGGEGSIVIDGNRRNHNARRMEIEDYVN